MNDNNLIGKRYINLVRCSTDGQKDTSIPDQLALLGAFAIKHEMVHVDDVLLEGISGSMPGNRSDLDQLVARKRHQDDYDILLVQDTTRLTRGGVEHGAKVEFDFAAVGIKIVFVADQLPDGDFGGVVKSFLYFSGKQAAKSTAFVSARGCMSALQQGRVAHCRRPPYAIDKAYVAADGTWLHVLRTLPNGNQLKLHPRTREVIGTFGKNAATGARSHYTKPKDEQVVLVPGDPAQVRVLNRIYRRRIVDGWGPKRIANELNAEGIVGPWGSIWHEHAIYSIANNPIYLGVGVANRYTCAIYYQRNVDQPKLARMDPAMLTRRTITQRIRPASEWFERAEPHLVEMLDEDLREPARLRQQEYWAARANGHVRKRRDRHVNSPFILKGLLHTKQGGHPMTGRLSGTSEHPTRYYRIARTLPFQIKGTIYATIVKAQPIEQAVLGVVREVLMAKTDLREAISKFAKAQSQLVAQDHDDLDQLIDERREQVEKLEFAIDALSALGREAVKRKIFQLEGTIASLDRRIEQTQKTVSPSRSGACLVDALMDDLGDLHDGLEKMPPESVRQLLSILIEKLEVDLETMEVEIELRLPSWAISSATSIKNALGLNSHSAEKREVQAQQGRSATLGLNNPSATRTGVETQLDNGMVLGRFSCVRVELTRCFECRRLAA